MLRIAAFALIAGAFDGDTIDMTGTRVRIARIDAPEAKQVCTIEGVEWGCGTDATAELASVIDEQSVTCTAINTDAYGRLVATCQVGIFNVVARWSDVAWQL